MTTNSTWAALRNPAFRKLWGAAVISGTCVVAHDNAATWMMSVFTGSPLLISLMSTVASLPFFLFTLPAGAVADRVDRQKLVCTINVCMAAAALTLAVLGWAHLLNPYLILGGVFFIGVGFAINAPAWTSIVRQVISDAELPSAATLGSLQLSIAGIIGPLLGGLLDPFLERKRRRCFDFPDACLRCHRSFKKLVTALDGGLTAGRNWSQMLHRIDLLRERFRAAVR